MARKTKSLKCLPKLLKRKLGEDKNEERFVKNRKEWSMAREEMIKKCRE
jgi:hypothetical protein